MKTTPQILLNLVYDLFGSSYNFFSRIG